ncbi:hypothetical protein [Thermococcus nautili]|uniref:Uncharacterized protein n=1 Tax=Thermococcus nautili TaxID=195522 RepID=U3RLM9_9EURY|nr:hypothetical protein [Thermococcus nautili]AGX15325.1 hypothetical protein TNaP3-11 [Thermococcus nautili]AHL21650.1 hypothetical protein BD01_0011 [Thermococcus nautili]
MRWKDWSEFPDVDDIRFKALRTLVFRELTRHVPYYRPRDILQRIKESYTIPGARIILFFVQRDNNWSYWEGVKSYLMEKYGYAQSTAENIGFKVVQQLCEFDGDKLRLRPKVYGKVIEVLESELKAREYAERFDYIIEEWLEAHGYYDDEEDEENEEPDDGEEVSEPSVKLVLRQGERVRLVLELEVVVKGVRFEVV